MYEPEYYQFCMTLPWRTGRSLGRTIYAVTTDPADDVLLGMMDTIEIAEHVVEDHNKLLEKGYGA
jgi:hypothetical protein